MGLRFYRQTHESPRKICPNDRAEHVLALLRLGTSTSGSHSVDVCVVRTRTESIRTPRNVVAITHMRMQVILVDSQGQHLRSCCLFVLFVFSVYLGRYACMNFSWNDSFLFYLTHSLSVGLSPTLPSRSLSPMATQVYHNPSTGANGRPQGASSPNQLQKAASISSPSSDLSDSSQDSSGGTKNSRTQFSPSQLLHLEQSFSKNPLPTTKRREQIAKKLELSPKHIQVCLLHSFSCLRHRCT